MSHLDVDTRADIYSLGALLYELLTGTPPFPEQRLRSAGYNEMQRIILEEQPVKPSTRLSTLQGEQRSIVARNRGASELTLGRAFPGDLDWIVMKCLEKDRTRRYETPNGLAMDIGRHLNNEAIVARAPSNIYRFQKLAQRNKLAFAAAAAVAGVLILGVIVGTWQPMPATGAEPGSGATRPAVVIESVLVDGQAGNLVGRPGPTLTITVPTNPKHVQIHYNATNLTSPDQARFRFRLLERDPNWVDGGTSRFVDYPMLPAGRYRFDVNVTDTEGTWYEGASTLYIMVNRSTMRSPIVATAALLLAITALCIFVFLSGRKTKC